MHLSPIMMMLIYDDDDISIMVFWEMGMKKRFELQMLSGWGDIWGDPWQCTFLVVAQFFLRLWQMSIGEEKESYICRKVGPALLIVDVLYIYMTPVNYTSVRKLYMQEVRLCIDDPSIHIQMTLCCGKLGNRNIFTFSNMNTVCCFLLMVFLYV